MTLVCEIFLKLEKHQQVAYLVGLEGHFDFLHGLPISFNILFRCVAYFFFSKGHKSLTSNKVMLSVPNGEGALPPPFLDRRPSLLPESEPARATWGQEHA